MTNKKENPKNKEYTMYNGSIHIKYVDSNHSYWKREIDKKGELGKATRIKGVTTDIGIIDKPALKYWAVNMCVDYLKEVLSTRPIDHHDIEVGKKKHTEKLTQAATIGSRIHEFCEAYIKGGKPEMPHSFITIRVFVVVAAGLVPFKANKSGLLPAWKHTKPSNKKTVVVSLAPLSKNTPLPE